MTETSITTEIHYKTDDIWCVIPVYNNAATLRDIAVACRGYLEHVLVMDDGSTDADVAELLSDIDITVIRHTKNKGKGSAILNALAYVQRQNARYIITIDADGQHDPHDLKKFIPLLQENDTVCFIGSRDFAARHIPKGSRIGRAIANFWLRVEAGVSIDDCQSGFRAYPVKYVKELKLLGTRYDFETEVLAKVIWAGLSVKTIPINVWYPVNEKRISHFHKVKDNLRISYMHARLVARQLLPLPHKKLILAGREKARLTMARHPIALIKYLLTEHASPLGLAAAAAVGIILATLPLVGLHTVAIIYITARLHLNKVMAVNIQHICMPPFVPVACIEVGYYMRYGKWLTDISFQTLIAEIHYRLFEWFLGSLIIGPILAVIIGICVLIIARSYDRKKATAGSAEPYPKMHSKKRGNALGLWFFKTAFLLFGLRAAYGLLYFVCIHYLIFDRPAVNAALAYIEKRFPQDKGVKRYRHVYRLFISQGMQLIDRYAVVSGYQGIKASIKGYDTIAPLLQKGSSGFVLVTAHVGNWQVAMTALKNIDKTIYLLMLPEQNKAVQDALRIFCEQGNIKIISPNAQLATVVEIIDVLTKGDIVSIMGDRHYGGASVEVDFLGHTAAFPTSSFVFAAAANVPVVVLLSSRQPNGEYVVDVSNIFYPAYSKDENKRSQHKKWVQEYADVLEEYLKHYPLQCFLFHDVWTKKKQ